jgi:deoxyribodipyrimidine photo-lyase
LRASWEPGEAGALERLRRFSRDALPGYAQQRDFPAQPGTSRLSPHLRHGEVGPSQVRWALLEGSGSLDGTPASPGTQAYLREIAWREFAYHLLHHFPHTPGEPLDPRFRAFPWRDDPTALEAWRRGRTGYPLIDAGMRELWHTGWMHNRVRMLVASFLTKNLRIDWRQGAGWFWDTLVDADLANNTLGWQWSAGCGADAAPYFRIFNPLLQGERFDPEGDYVRRWVPELGGLGAERIHRPRDATRSEAADAGGSTHGDPYPGPIVDLSATRRDALGAWEAIKRPTTDPTVPPRGREGT